MKTKHLQKFFIGCAYAMLISVVFFLNPYAAKAQVHNGCSDWNPSTTPTCCVDAPYVDLVKGCVSAGMVQADGTILGQSGGGTGSVGYDILIGDKAFYKFATMSSRFTHTVKDMGDGTVQLRLFILGYAKVSMMMTHIMYDHQQLTLTAVDGSPITLNGTHYANVAGGAQYFSIFDPAFKPTLETYTPNANDGYGDYTPLSVDFNTDAVNGAYPMIAAGEAHPILTLYFTKNTPNNNLSSDAFGFLAAPEGSGSYCAVVQGVLKDTQGKEVAGLGGPIVSANSLPSGNAYISIPSLFEFRSTAEITTDEALANARNAILNGNFKSGVYPAATNLPTATSINFLANPPQAKTINNIGVRAVNDITYCGFIYTTATDGLNPQLDPKIEYNPGSVYDDDLITSISITFDGETETFDYADLLAAAGGTPLAVGGEEFYVILKANTDVDAQYDETIDVVAGKHYTYWTLGAYQYGASNPFLLLGDPKEFDAVDCMELPEVAVGNLCNNASDAELSVTNTADYDAYAPKTITYQWYSVENSVETELTGETNPTLTVSAIGDYKIVISRFDAGVLDCVADTTVTVEAIQLATPVINGGDLTACKSTISPLTITNADEFATGTEFVWKWEDAGNPMSETTTVPEFFPPVIALYTVTAEYEGCSTISGAINVDRDCGLVELTQAVNPNPMCSGGTTDVTVTVINLEQEEAAVVVLVTPDAGLVLDGTPISTTGAYDPDAHIWTLTVPAESEETLTITYSANNANNTPINLNHTATITDINGVSLGDDPIVSIETVEVLPIPTVNRPTSQEVCAGNSTSVIIFTSNAAGTTYEWTNDKPEIGLAATGTGPVPSFVAINATNIPITATITVTPISASGMPAGVCIGDTVKFTITVDPLPTIAPFTDVAYCNETAVPEWNLQYYVSPDDATAVWEVVGGASIGLPNLSGTNTIPAFNTVNNGTTPLYTLIKITPTYNNCEGTPKYLIIRVMPEIIMDPVSDMVVCNGTNIPEINFSSAATGVSFRWTLETQDDVLNAQAIGMIGEGAITPYVVHGFIPAFTAHNYTDEVITVNIKAWAYMSDDYLICPEEPEIVEFSISVNPELTVDPVDDQMVCAGNEVGPIVFESNVDGARYKWEASANAATIGFTSLTGYDEIPLISAVNTTPNPITVHIKVTPEFENQIIPGNISFCYGAPIYFDIIVNPIPNVNQIADQELCAGQRTDDIIFTGNTSNTIYEWINSTPGIGLNASGVGNILAFTATNNTNEPLVATITVIPMFVGGDPSEACISEDFMEFTITVNPMPTVDVVANQVVCNGGEVDVTFSGNMTENVIYKWAVDNIADAAYIGMDLTYDGDINFTANNTTDNAITVNVTVTPVSIGNDIELCTGTPRTFSITVSPVPTMQPIESQTVCLGTMTTNIDFGAVNAPVGTIFHWTNDNTAIGLPATGTGNITAFMPTATGVANITVIPQYPNGSTPCEPEEGLGFTITVNPMPTVDVVANQVVCNGGEVDVTFSGNMTENVIYKWTVDNIADAAYIGMDLTYEGDINFTANNTTDNAITVNVTVTPVSIGNDIELCTGTSRTFSITVSPVPTMQPIESQTVCLGTMTTNIDFGAVNAPVGTIFHWTNDNTAIGLPATGTGNITAFMPTATGVANITVIPQYPNGSTPCEPEEGLGFTITVNPMPTVDVVANQVVCDGGEVDVTFSGNMTENVIYKWAVDNIVSAEYIGMDLTYEGDINFTANNTTDNAITVNVTVTPVSIGNDIELCTGTSRTFSITVSPIPTMQEIASQEICVGEMTAVVNFGALQAPAGTIFHWENDSEAIGLPAAGTGNIPSFRVLAAVEATITVTPEYPNGSTPCIGEILPFTITGYDVPVMTPVENVTVCHGDMVDQVPPFESTVSDVEFTWHFVTGQNIGLDVLSGTGDFPEFEAVNETLTPISAAYAVKASSASNCYSQEVFFIITVNPIPTVDPVVDAVYCHNALVPAHVFTGNTVGATYVWWQTNTNTVTIPELPTSGTDILPAFTAINLNNEAITLEYAVYASYDYAGHVCPSDPEEAVVETFAITINPAPVVNPMSNIIFCNGEATGDIEFTGTIADAEYRWEQVSGDTITTDETDLFAGGQDVIPTFIATNSGNNALVAIIRVTPWTADGLCSGAPIEFTITVKPTPTVDQVASQELCAGARTNDVIFTGNTSGTIYSWTNDTPEIGLAAEGTGNIGAFNTVNNTDEPIVATIIVTPVFIQGNPEDACEGEPKEFTITVNPMPTVDVVANQVVCNGGEVDVTFSGNMTENVIYKWAVDNIADAAYIGMDLTYDGDINFTANNTTDNAITVNVTVTPVSIGNDIELCTGTSRTFSITVSPIPTMQPIESQTVCLGTMTTDIDFGAVNAPVGTIFHWTNDNTAIGLPATGTGNIPAFIPTATGVANITVIPQYPNGSTPCEPEEGLGFTITVNPVPTVSPITDMTFCNGEIFEEFDLNSYASPDNATIEWEVVSGANIGLENLFGVNSIPEFTVENTGNIPLYTLIKATPVYNNCKGTPTQFIIKAIPEININDITSITVCSQTNIPETHFGSAVEGVFYVWEATDPAAAAAIGMPESGGGDNFIPAFTAHNYTTEVITVEIEVYAYMDDNYTRCQSDPTSFTISVNPQVDVDHMEDIIVCAGTTIEDITFNGTVPGTTYKWTASANAAMIGLALTGVDEISEFTALNNTPNPITVHVTVTPTYENPGSFFCDGTPMTFDIVVNPTPNVYQIADQELCAGQRTDDIIFTGNTSNTIYEWINDTPEIGLNGSGVGNILAFTATNNTNEPLVATIMVIPMFVGGDPSEACIPEDFMEFTITVNPMPTVDVIANQVVCNGGEVDVTFSGNMTENVIYKWSVDNIEDAEYIGMDLTYEGDINFTANNTTDNAITVNVTVTPVSIGLGVDDVEVELCTGTSRTFSITVSPIPTMQPIESQTVCLGTMTTDIDFGAVNAPVGTIFHWTNDNTAIGLPATGTGNIPAFMPTATGVANITVIPQYPNGSTPCEPEEGLGFTITVNPVPTVLAITDRSYCYRAEVPAMDLTRYVSPGATAEWEVEYGSNIGFTDLRGTDTIPSFIAISNSTTIAAATFKVTPVQNNCRGESKYFVVFVMPKMVVDQPENYTVCSQTAVPEIRFSGYASGVTYSWTASENAETIGMQELSGHDFIPTFVAHNYTAEVITVTVDVYSFMSDPFEMCSSDTISFTISVNPQVDVTHMEDIVVCAGATIADITFDGTIPGTTFKWEASSNAAAIGFEELTGIDMIDGFVALNNTPNPITVQVTVTPTYENPGSFFCDGAPMTFDIVVNPTPNVYQIADQELCAGQRTDDIIFTGNTPNTIYEWINDTPGIGLSSTGVGNILAFTATNNTNEPVVATIMVTPMFVGGDPGEACVPETPMIFTITVNPMPTVDVVANQVVCNGGEVDVTFSGNMTENVIYKWTVNNVVSAEYIGMNLTYEGDINFTANNTTDNAITVDVTVTPVSVDGDIELCTGTSRTFSITVSPIPTMQPIENQTVCLGTMTTNIDFGAVNAPVGTIFHWTNDNTAIGLPATGTGNIPAFMPTATGVANITVIPQYPNGSAPCEPEEGLGFTITVNPIPTVLAITNRSYCYRTEVPEMDLTRYVSPGATAEWEVEYGSNIGFTDLSGTDTIPSFIAISNSTTIAAATFKVTPVQNNCRGESKYFVVFVMPKMVVDQPENYTVCSQTAVPEIHFSGYASGVTYSWTASENAETIGMQELSGHDFIPTFVAHNYTAEVITVTVDVYSFMSDPFEMCSSDTISFTISVNPEVDVNHMNDIIVCAGETIADITFDGTIPGTTFKWEASSNAAAIGLNELTGIDMIDEFVALNNTPDPITVHIKVTPTYENPGSFFCDGAPMFFDIVVNPTPNVYQIADQELCAGQRTDDIIFRGNIPNTMYEWINDTPEIGLNGSGIGDILAFTATNNTNEPLVATIMVTPMYVGHPGEACISEDPMIFTITVNPMPTVNAVSNQAVCNGGEINVEFSGNMTENVIYKWNVDNVANAEYIGMDLTYEGDIHFIANNTTGNVITVNVTVTPVSSIDSVELCVGNARTFSITVSPIPTMQPIQDQIVCLGTMTTPIIFSATQAPIGTIFRWTVDNPSIGLGLAASGSGDIPSFVTIEAGVANFTVTAEYPNGSGSCEPEEGFNFTITVNPIPTALAITDRSYCYRTEVPEIDLTRYVSPGATAEWEVEFGANIGFTDLRGTDTIPSFLAISNSTEKESAIFKVTPVQNNCRGESKYFTVSVFPEMTIDPVESITICSNTNVPETHFSGYATAARVAWNAPNATAIGMRETSGHDFIPAFTAKNNSDEVITITVEVYSFMSDAFEMCSSDTTYFTISVNPEVDVNPVDDIIVCAGEPIADIIFDGTIPGTTYKWTASSNAASIGFGELAGVEMIEGFVALNNTPNPITVQVTVTPTYENPGNFFCNGTPMTFNIVVNPTPNVYQIADQELCAGQRTDDIIFTGNTPNTIYEWFNDTPGIGLNGSGVGNILAFTAINTTNEPLVATITVTPRFVAGDPGAACEGEPMEFMIVVNPMPTVDFIADQIVCNENDVDIEFTSNMTENVIYTWTVDNVANAEYIGMNLTYEGDINFVANNTTDNSITVNVTVTPVSVDGDIELCTGTPRTFSITVSPIPTMQEIASQEICVGDMTAVVNFGALQAPAGTLFHWTNDNPAIGLPAAGTGNIPSFRVLAAVEATITVTPEYPNGSTPCIGEILPFTITGYERPIMTPIENITVCTGDEVVVPTFVSTLPEATYTWRYVSGEYIGLDEIEGIGQFPIFEAVNTTTTALSTLYAVKANGGAHCDGPEIFFVITVNPMPTIDDVASSTYCNNALVPTHVFTGNTPNAIYHWIQTNYNEVSIPELPSEGYGALPPFTAINLSNEAITLEYEVYVSFDYAGHACENEIPATFSITINPTPEVNPVTNMIFCKGSSTGDIEFTGTVADAEYRWVQKSGDVITEEIDLFAGGQNYIPSFETINAGNNTLIATIQVTPWTADGLCPGTPIEFTITIKPTPTVDQIASQTLCAGERTNDVIFTGNTTGTIYRWTNDAPEIGLAAEGTGNIGAFNTVNNTDEPIVATITVTPTFMQGNPNDACEGETMEFTITVNPMPIITPVANVITCADNDVDILFTSNNMINNVVYDWYVDNVANAEAIGMDLSNLSANPIQFTTENVTMHPITVTVTVTPRSIDPVEGNTLCVGQPTSFTITVDPIPTVSEVEDQIVCANETTAAVNFSGSIMPAGTQYHWTNDTPAIGLPAEGWGDIAPFVALNPGVTPLVATITVTPVFSSGTEVCNGDNTLSETFTITVNPIPVVTPVADQTYCSGVTTTIPTFGSTVPGAVFTWTQVEGPSIGGQTSGTGHFQNFQTSNTGLNAITARYKVVASIDDCESLPVFFEITVLPVPHIDPVENKAYCNNTNVPAYVFTGSVPGALYAWTFIGGDNIGNLPGSGVGSMPQFTTTNTTDHVLTARYRVTATYNFNGTPCGGEQQEFSISVLPEPTVTGLQNVAYCHNDEVVIPAFSGIATTWRWRQTEGQNIGLNPTNGEGQIPEFIAQNLGTTPIMALIEVIPYYETEGISCPGEAAYFTIQVNPQPTMNTVSDMLFCNGTTVPAFNFGGNASGATYHWEFVSGDVNTNLPTSGTGSLPTFITINNTDDVLTANYVVWATYDNYNGTGCTSAEQNFSITVLPTPTVDINALPTIFCHKEEVPAIHFEGNIPVTSSLNVRYEWNFVDGDYIGTALYGVNTIPFFIAENTGTTPLTAHYTVTPIIEYQGQTCKGTTMHFSFTVNPKARLTSPEHAGEICSGAKFNYTATADVIGVTFTWERPAIEGINNGEAGVGYTAVVNEVLTNTLSYPVTVEYHFTMYGKCTDPEEIFVVRVVVLPTAVMTSSTDGGEICSGGVFDYTITSNVANAAFTWRRLANPDINGGTANSGVGAHIHERLNNTSNGPITVKYEVTLYHEGCEGNAKTYIVSVVVDAKATIALEPITQVCSNDAIACIPYTTEQNLAYEYKIVFWADAVAAGFQDILLFQRLDNEQCIPVPMPKNAAPNRYTGTLIIRGVGCEVTSEYEFKLDVLQGTYITGDLEDADICINNPFALDVTAIGDTESCGATSLTYTWYHDGQVVATTNTGVYYKEEATVNDAGTYYVVVSGCCGIATSRVATITIKESLIAQKFDDVLYVSNINGGYASYQWYRVIDGEKYAINEHGNAQYYSDKNMSGWYQVEMYDGKGKLVAESCPFKVDAPAKNTIITIYPNPVSQGGMLTVDMSDMKRDQIENARIEVYDMVGKQITVRQVDDHRTKVTMPLTPGAYVVRVIGTTGETLKTDKVIVK